MLAGASDTHLARYAVCWAETEQAHLHRNGDGVLLLLLRDIVNLVRLGQAREEALYFWIFL